jgi:glucosamine--fructose-6-phosphate aminotransferase (isomerizing)
MDHPTTKLYQSIHAQPGAIRELLADREGPARAAELLARAERVLLAGIGTSYHATLVGEAILRLAGADAWALRSFEFVNYPRPLRASDALIVVSHRGGKMYSLAAIERAHNAQVPTIGITGKSTKMQGTDMTLETVEQDPSSAHSISYTTAIIRLGQIAAHLAALQGRAEQTQRIEQGMSQIPALMEKILARESEVQQIAQEAARERRRIYFVGAGPNATTAPEGALKAKETAYVTAEGFELEQAIHGPLVAFEAADLLIPISVRGAAQPRMADLLRALSEIGSRVWLLGEAPDAETDGFFQREGWARFALADGADLPEELTPLLAALPVQLLAHFLAAARGTDADGFRLEQERYKRGVGRVRL